MYCQKYQASEIRLSKHFSIFSRISFWSNGLDQKGFDQIQEG